MPSAEDIANFNRLRSAGPPKVVPAPPKLELGPEVEQRFPAIKTRLDDYNRRMSEWVSQQLGITINQ